jgi:glycosyltransferase involved in cell wall biosynthesis
MSRVGAGLSVVVLNSYCRAQGGASRVAIDSAIGLAQTGAEVTFLGAVGPVCPELAAAPLKTICLMQRDLIAAPGSAAVILQGLWNRKVSTALDEVLAGSDPERTVVHLHGFPQALSSSPVRLALRRGFRCICTLHEFFVACPTGAFFDFRTMAPCPLRALSMSCVATNCDKRSYAHKLYRVTRSVIQRQFGRLPTGIKEYIGLSRRSVEMLRSYLPSDSHIHPVPNPVNVIRKPAVRPAMNRNVVAIGRLDEEKGVRLLLDAARQSQTQLTLVGDGPLRGLVEASGICRVTGWLTRDAVMAELESARCLVFPSLWYETFGLVVDEAAARGIPAIVSDISAAAERVVDGVTGWHVRAGDRADLSRCLTLIEDDTAVGSAGDAAYQRWWSDPPTLERHVEKLTDVYRTMLSR